jgi:hypothetical protein
MSAAIANAWLMSLFGVAIGWLGLILWTFRRLRVRHAETYKSIGSPSLFWNNSMRNNWLFVKFLFQGQWHSLNDPQLAGVARCMQFMFVVYMAGLLGLIVTFLVAGIKPA